MRRTAHWMGLAFLVVSLVAAAAVAGEPLVSKASDGRYLPAAALEWARAGANSFRFVLRDGGPKAAAVAQELRPKLSPVQVEATDDLTLVFRAEGLEEAPLLEKLAALPLGGDRAIGDALAALSGLGEEAGAGPTLGDLSSAGSIRASKSFELPAAAERASHPANLVGKIVGVEPCDPMPVLHLELISAPKEGEHAAAFLAGRKVAVRGYYKLDDQTKKLDESDERTRINLATRDLAIGDVVYGKPFTQDGSEWVLETIEKKIPQK